MGNIKLNNEQREELYVRFLSDTRILSHQNMIAKIYSTAMLKGIRKTDGSFEVIYDDKTEELVKKVRSRIDEIIRADYSDIVTEI